jgi:hypothetical protein
MSDRECVPVCVRAVVATRGSCASQRRGVHVTRARVSTAVVVLCLVPLLPPVALPQLAVQVAVGVTARQGCAAVGVAVQVKVKVKVQIKVKVAVAAQGVCACRAECCAVTCCFADGADGPAVVCSGRRRRMNPHFMCQT